VIQTSIEAVIDTVAAVIQPLLNTVAALVNAFGGRIGLVGPHRSAAQRDARDDSRCLDEIPKLPCIHDSSP